jgi:hypothetical protein
MTDSGCFGQKLAQPRWKRRERGGDPGEGWVTL